MSSLSTISFPTPTCPFVFVVAHEVKARVRAGVRLGLGLGLP